MKLNDIFHVDPYNRKARMMPFLYIVYPPFLGFTLLLSIWFFPWFQSLEKTYFTYLAAIPVTLTLLPIFFYGFASNIINPWISDKGKKVEKSMYKGILPSVRLLRHSNNTLDKLEQRELHKILRAIYEDWPTEEFENKNKDMADEIYKQACRNMLEKTRGHELLKEKNMEYGFWRNVYSLRKNAIGLNITSILFVSLITYATKGYPLHIHEFAERFIFFVIFLSWLVVHAWFFGVYLSKVKVHSRALDYAFCLLRAGKEVLSSNS